MSQIILENVDKLRQMEEKYNNYIDRHRKAVLHSFESLISIPEDEQVDFLLDEDNIAILRAIIEKHDESKYSEEEFEPYRKHFDPVDDEESLNTEEYETAWIHHYTCNPHHWEYWCYLDSDTGEFVLKDDIDEDDYKFYEIERLCDWCAMSRQFGNRVSEWYEQNKHKIVQPDFIIPFQEELMKLIDKYQVDISSEDYMSDEESKD